MRVRGTAGWQARGRAAGFTLLEVILSASVLAMLGFALSDAIRMADSSHTAVTSIADTNRALRETTDSLARELKSARAADIAVVDVVDGNQQLTFRHPVEVGGNAVWGVHDKRLGPTPDQQNRENWSVRYTVSDVLLGPGNLERRLVRQLLDEIGEVRVEDVLVRGLEDGPNPPGFTVVENGGVREIALRTQGEGSGNDRVSIFHVRPRN